MKVHREGVSATNFDQIGVLLTASVVAFSARLSPVAVKELEKSPLVKFIEPVAPIVLY